MGPWPDRISYEATVWLHTCPVHMHQRASQVDTDGSALGETHRHSAARQHTNTSMPVYNRTVLGMNIAPSCSPCCIDLNQMQSAVEQRSGQIPGSASFVISSYPSTPVRVRHSACKPMHVHARAGGRVRLCLCLRVYVCACVHATMCVLGCASVYSCVRVKVNIREHLSGV